MNIIRTDYYSEAVKRDFYINNYAQYVESREQIDWHFVNKTRHTKDDQRIGAPMSQTAFLHDRRCGASHSTVAPIPAICVSQFLHKQLHPN